MRGAPSVHRFSEMTQLTSITIPANNSTAGVISFNLGQLTNQASFKSLFDLYRITAAKVTFLYRNNSATTSAAPNIAELPMLYTAINRDPFVPAPTSVADILNDDTCRIHRADALLGKGGVYVKSPKPDMSGLVYVEGQPAGGIVTQQWNLGVGNSKQYWLCTGGNSQGLDQSLVNHFGVRYFAENLSNSNVQTIQVFATLYFQMKEQD